MKRITVAFAALLVGLVVAGLPRLTPPVTAGEVWCWDDPVVKVGDRVVDIRVQLPMRHLLTVRSTRLTVVIPKNVHGAVLVDDVSAFPMETTVSATGPVWNGSGPLPIRVLAQVHATAPFEYVVIVQPVVDRTQPASQPTTARGSTGRLLTFPVALGR